MQMSNVRISGRLGLGFGAVLTLLVVTTGIAVFSLWRMVDVIHTFADDHVRKLSMVADWQISTLHTFRQSRNAVIIDKKDLVEKELSDLLERRKDRQKLSDELARIIVSDAGRKALQEVHDAYAPTLPSEDEFIRLRRAGDVEGAKQLLLETLRPRQLAFLGALDKLLASQKALVAAARVKADEQYAVVLAELLGFAAVALLAGIVAAAWLNRTLAGPIRSAAQTARRIADGDLTTEAKPVEGRNEPAELLTALAGMQANLARIVGEVRQGSDAVVHASTEIAQGNHDLSGRTEQQASALQQTAASMEQLNATVKQNADNASAANTLATNACSVATRGGEEVAEVVHTMRGINDSSRKIADIINVIDAIAFQTNILALNAAVEAARAGEQGRGFAVVASEVRGLAGRSAEAAREIKTLIHDSVQRVEKGTALVDKAGATVTEVVEAIRRVTTIMGEISLASTQQRNGVQQVGEAVTQIDHTTQQNAALVEQMAAAASSLKSQAEDLVSAVSVFKLVQQAALAAARVATPLPASAPAARPVRPSVPAPAVSAGQPFRLVSRRGHA